MNQEFSCCSFYADCDYGKKECYFIETDSTKKDRCRCYQLKKDIREGKEASPVKMEKVIIHEEKEGNPEKIDQLSLF